MSRSLIEQWFPAATVGGESVRERATFTALPPLFALHVWWARRPLVASRAAVVGTLLPAWPSDEEVASNERDARIAAALTSEFRDEDEYRQWFIESIGILGDPVGGRRAIASAREQGARIAGNPYGYPRAFTVSPQEETIARIQRLAAIRAEVSDPPVLLDPFSGGGSIPFEAARYGCETFANELNPVAVAILNGTVDLPIRLDPSFAQTLESWGNRWAHRVEKTLKRFFPQSDEAEVVLDYIWATTVPCPTTGLPTPLAPDLWLSRGNDDDAAVRLDIDREAETITTAIVRGREAKSFGARSTYKSGTAVSIWTDETFGGEYIREHALAGGLGYLLLAIVFTGPGVSGRQFRAPTAADVEATVAAEEELERQLPAWQVAGLVPSEPIDAPSNYDRGHRMYGILTWRDFFTPRQLLTHLTALSSLREVITEARSTLGEDDARALNLYLAFALDKAVDYNSRQASWNARAERIRNTFDKHNFAFKWTFAEPEGARSLLRWTVGQVTKVFRGIADLAGQESLLESDRGLRIHVTLGSATDLSLPDSSVDAVVTDPPYYDNVMYGECSDFFYVWLKRSLADNWPDLVRLSLTDKEQEAVANPALFRDLATHSGRGRRTEGSVSAAELADRRYEELLTRSFSEIHRVLKPDGVATVMFTHKRVDAWDTLGAALLNAGFAIQSSWPVHTEPENSLHQAKKNAAASTILLTCRKRETTDPAWWKDIRRDVEVMAESAARQFATQGIRGVDLTLATYGPVLSVLSRRWPVYTGELDSEGNQELLRPDIALDLAREKVSLLKKRDLLSGREVDFDRFTDWWLLAWSDFQAEEFPFDEARKLSMALHLDVDDAKRRRLVSASGGTVKLLTPAQRRTAGALDPDASSWDTQIDALHSLMLAYDEEGIGAAQAWLDRTARRDDQRFLALVEAAIHAIPRVRQKDELVRPEARVLESMRQTLFPSIEPPADPTPPAEQLVLETA